MSWEFASCEGEKKKKKVFCVFLPFLAVCKTSFLKNQIVVLELTIAFEVFVPVQIFFVRLFPPPARCHIPFIYWSFLILGQFCLMDFRGIFITGQKKTPCSSPKPKCRLIAFTEDRSRWLDTCSIRRLWFAAKINGNWIWRASCLQHSAPNLRIHNAI